MFTLLVTQLCSFWIDQADYVNTGDDSGAWKCFILFPILGGLSLILTVFIRQRLDRTEAEEKALVSGSTAFEIDKQAL